MSAEAQVGGRCHGRGRVAQEVEEEQEGRGRASSLSLPPCACAHSVPSPTESLTSSFVTCRARSCRRRRRRSSRRRRRRRRRRRQPRHDLAAPSPSPTRILSSSPRRPIHPLPRAPPPRCSLSRGRGDALPGPRRRVERALGCSLPFFSPSLPHPCRPLRIACTSTRFLFVWLCSRDESCCCSRERERKPPPTRRSESSLSAHSLQGSTRRRMSASHAQWTCRTRRCVG